MVHICMFHDLYFIVSNIYRYCTFRSIFYEETVLLENTNYFPFQCKYSMLSSTANMHFCHCSSGYFKTSSHHPVWACLACFEAFWHILTSDLAFLVHLVELRSICLLQARPTPRVIWYFDILLSS